MAGEKAMKLSPNFAVDSLETHLYDLLTGK